VGAPENLTRDAIVRVFKAAQAVRAPLVYWSIVPAPGSAGVPDFIACVGGALLGVEAKATKADGGRGPTELQKKRIASIQAAEGTAMVVQEEVDFRTLHLTVQRLTGYMFPCPQWRSKAALKRRAPPPVPKPTPPTRSG
jgi:hypothetical protein